MRVGSDYNPYRLFHGAFIPNWLMKRTELSFGAKIIFARLAQYAGEDGECWPAHGTLAEEIGCSRRNVIRLITELLEHRLIRVTPGQHDGHESRYKFVVHKWMKEAFDEMLEGGYDKSVTPPRGGVTDPAQGCDGSVTGGCDGSAPKEIHVEEIHEEIQKERACVPGSPVLGEPAEIERQALLSLSEDTFVNRWLKTYQHHRPGAGHPMRNLSVPEMADVRMRIEDLEREFGEDRAMALLAAVFSDKRRPTSPAQAVLYCQKHSESESKESKNGDTTPVLWSREIVKWHPETDA